MLKHTFRYLFVPAIALLITMQLYTWVNNVFSGNETAVVKSSGEALIGGDFELTNQRGEKIKSSDFKGKLMLVYFGFTNCPMVCPTDMAIITEAMNGLGSDAEAVQPIFITIDPERDDVPQLKSFAANFYSSLQALTGTAEEIASVANAYRVFYKKAKADNLSEYLMDHSAYSYLMGRDGKYITHFRHDQPVDEIIAGIKRNL